MGIAAGISAIGSLGAGFMTSSAADSAAKTQAAATQQAVMLQQQQYDQTRHDLKPYRQTGQSANALLNSQLPALTTPFAPTQASLEATPGYQFDLSQGLKSTQSSAAARGLGISGAALKGAATYATGLADNTLQTQFNIDQQNKQNSYNKLLGTTSLGEGAAAQTGALGSAAATGSANALLTGAAGQSASQIAAGTAFNPLLQNANSYYQMTNFGLGNGANGSAQLQYTGAGNAFLRKSF